MVIFAKKIMKHYHITICPFYNSEDLVKNGHSATGIQRWRCNTCKKVSSWIINIMHGNQERKKL
jgi:transposase-like protein